MTADSSLWHWANLTADSKCDAECKVNAGLKERGTWWEGVDQAADQVCWGCEQEPWPNERSYGHQIWNAIHQANLPIRQVAAKTNLWSVPCPRGIERRGRGTRCLIGHYVYGIMCFFKWMGEPGQENFALTNLESVMDLAPIVQKSPCKDNWAFPVAEVSENYERILTLVWHLSCASSRPLAASVWPASLQTGQSERAPRETVGISRWTEKGQRSQRSQWCQYPVLGPDNLSSGSGKDADDF